MTHAAFLPSTPFPPRLQLSKSAPTPLQLRAHVLCTTTRPHTPPHVTTTTPLAPSSTPPSPPPPPSPNPQQVSSLFILNLVTILWGTQHAVIKLSVDSMHVSPSALNFLRFLLATLVSLPFLPSLRHTQLWRYGLQQSLWMFLGYAMQAVALQTTTAARSGFLLYLNVKIVPLLAWALYSRTIQPSVWASAALALFGTVLLSYDGSPPVIGDAWSIAAAFASAMFIVQLERASKRVPAAALSAMSLAGVTLMSGVWVLCEAMWRGGADMGRMAAQILPDSLEGGLGVVYLGLVATALSNYLQALGQKNVPAERAAVVYALDPVYGAIFAGVLLGERLGVQGLVGAGLVGVAAIWSGKGLARGEQVEDEDKQRKEEEIRI